MQYAALTAAEAEATAPARAEVRAWVAAALAAAGRSGEVAVRFVGAEESAALNGKYRRKDAPTNVLSFDYRGDDGGGGDAVLGDILVCVPVVQQEAAQRGIPAQAHYAHLVVHGALHLAGHRHSTPAEAAKMESLEIRVLRGFGITDPYR